jgi:hypothetical protein
MRSVIPVVVLVVVALAGCGRSDEDAVKDYCTGRLSCGVDPNTSQAALEACQEEYLHPTTGTPQEQCVTRARAVCIGDCYHDNGCGVFYQNDPCTCDLEGYDCP